MFTQSMFTVGGEARFSYNDKERVGTVEKLTDSYLVLKFDDGTFKTFRFEYMEPIGNGM